MRKIVLVDDDRDVVNLLEATLSSRGYLTVTTNNGSQAWRVIQRERPDATILDLNMPGLNGLDVCRRIRSDPATRQIGVLFLTGSDDPASKSAAFKAGADDYIVKPFTPRELRQRLEAVLQRVPAADTGLAATAREGQIVSLRGVKGGVGTSVLAVNLAVALALQGATVCLVDLDLERAGANVLLDLELFRGGTIADLSRGRQPTLGWAVLGDYLLSHGSGVRLLPGPVTPVDAGQVTGEHAKAFLGLLRQHHEFVLVDLPADYRDVTLDAIGVSDQILLVVTPDILALKQGNAALDVLAQLKVRSSTIRVILNQPAPGVPLSVGDVKRSVRASLVASIPYGGEAFVNAVATGAPLVQSQSEHPAALAIRRLGEELLSATKSVS